MKISGDWFENAHTQAVFAMLNDAGYLAYMVGGCVRNALIGTPVSDIDISTDARPETVTKLAVRAGLKVIPTGIDHGTVTVISGHEPHEITTFRYDVETDGRRAVVAYSDRIEDDAERRDFTMNALYADAQGRIVDPLGGLDDLIARRVRFIGHAEDRIHEDYLRILRFFRFNAWYADPDLGFDPDAMAAIAANLSGLDALSKERIGHELRKLLAAPDPSRSVASMAQTGVLAHILPGASARVLPVLVHLEAEAGQAPHWQTRLAALGAHDLATALRLSRTELREVAQISEAANEIAQPEEHGYRLGADLGLRSWLLRLAKLETVSDPEALSRVAFGAGQSFPVKAADLMERLQGPALGAALKHLEARWIASGFSLTREELLADD